MQGESTTVKIGGSTKLKLQKKLIYGVMRTALFKHRQTENSVKKRELPLSRIGGRLRSIHSNVLSILYENGFHVLDSISFWAFITHGWIYL